MRHNPNIRQEQHCSTKGDICKCPTNLRLCLCLSWAALNCNSLAERCSSTSAAPDQQLPSLLMQAGLSVRSSCQVSSADSLEPSVPPCPMEAQSSHRAQAQGVCSTARGSCSCILLLLHHPCKKELRTLGEDTAKALLSLSEGAVKEVLDKLCWTQGLVEGRGMKAGGRRQLHPCSGWAEPIPCSLPPCQSQPPWDSELPKAPNLCLLCTQ